jgi:prefoldin subunit 5
MNEIILAYGLGVLSIGTGVLIRMVLKAEKKVNEQDRQLTAFQQEYRQSVESIYRQIETVERSANYSFEVVDRKIDSRIDKLEVKMKDQVEYIRNKTSQEY